MVSSLAYSLPTRLECLSASAELGSQVFCTSWLYRVDFENETQLPHACG